MKKTWTHGSKCGTMRVITATLRNGRVVVASGGPDRARKRERSLLWFSCWFPRRPAWTRIMLSARHRTRYQMPAHEDRYTPLLLRPETSIVYLRRRRESEKRGSGGDGGSCTEISRFEITSGSEIAKFSIEKINKFTLQWKFYICQSFI